MSARLVSPTVVKHFFYNALALNALPVHLLRQVFFRSLEAPFFVFVFSEFFCFRFLELSFSILEFILELFGGPLEVILVTFWGSAGSLKTCVLMK